ncbi:hypothetical protein J7T55_013371 [Diaporthe amygdali]|uniref:uncharacterized protein n=1 Tax=Phomopsis amygdali TaxID=1214568 RepID=UPI0022FDDD61|nr:uncharacterized protein J7T55_013371 [Diaporthe amygdali]KAJ0119136.1 hypothetical protein J7T55_013371 [Diaporthe amygdali]
MIDINALRLPKVHRAPFTSKQCIGRRLRMKNGEDRVQMPTCQSGQYAPLTAQISLLTANLTFLGCDIEGILIHNFGS